jgi:hypothetical protein
MSGKSSNEQSNTNPGLNSRALVGEEAQVEMSRLLAIEGETIHTLRRISSQRVLEEEIYNDMINNVVSIIKKNTHVIHLQVPA